MPKREVSPRDLAVRIAIALIVLTVLWYVSRRDKSGISESSPGYQAACQGPPLRTAELRSKAMEDGYEINRQYDCIDKSSFVARAQERARWEAANTPEAKAKRAAERAELIAEEQARTTATAESQGADEVPSSPPPRYVVRPAEANTATERELASVVAIGPEVAAQIVEERTKRPFKDWPDLVRRVIGVSSANNAFLASVGGLTVNGQSLPGAPPNVPTDAFAKEPQTNPKP